VMATTRAVQGAEEARGKRRWEDCQVFLKKLSEKCAAARDLPSADEAQWEYACRAGSTGRWSFGDSEMGLTIRVVSEELGEEDAPCGGRSPTPGAFSDMHGNVWNGVRIGLIRATTRRHPESTQRDTLRLTPRVPRRLLRQCTWTAVPRTAPTTAEASSMFWPACLPGSGGVVQPGVRAKSPAVNRPQRPLSRCTISVSVFFASPKTIIVFLS